MAGITNYLYLLLGGLPFSQVHLTAVLVASVANMALGFVWYAPPVFGTTWMNLVGVNKKKKNMQLAVLQGFLSTLVATYFLAMILVIVQPWNMQSALIFGVVAWLAVAMPIEFGAYVWEGRSLKVFFITGAQSLLAILVTVAVLTVM